jgi:PAS domain S-box-containing protein
MSIFWQFLGFGLVNFIYAFLNKKRDNIYYFLGCSYVAFVIISFLTDLALPPNIYFNLSFLFNLLVPTIYTIYLLLYAYTNSKSQKYNKQIKFIIWGCVVAFILGFMGDTLVHNIWGNDVKWRIGSTVTILQAVVFLPALIKYNFLLTPVDERAVNLFTFVEEGLIITNDKGQILNLNERAKNLLNIDKKQWKHRIINEFLQEFTVGEIYKNYETQLFDNSNIWIACSVSQVKEMNVLLGYIIILRDVTDRNIAQIALSKSERRYRELYDNAPAAYFSISKDGRINSCNARVSEILNYDNKELIGKKIFSLYADNNYGKPRAMKVFEQFKQGNTTLNEELQMLKKDGSPIWINLTVFPVKDNEGNITETRSMVVDIHQRKETQRQLESNRLQMLQAQNIAQLGSWEWDLINKNYSWSDNLYELYGVNRNEFIISEDSFISLVHEDDRKHVIKTIRDCLTTQIPMDYYHRTIPINGISRTMHCIGMVISDENGNPLSMVGTAQDVTSKIEAEDEIRNSREELRELSKHLQTIQEEERAFISREIHDELGQRLTGIKMDLSWIKNKLSDENVDIYDRIASLNELIDDTVISVRKISSELHPAILDDLGLRAAIEWQVSEFVKRTGIYCNLDIHENDFDFDKDQSKAIFRILQESLTNIMRHSQAKKVDIGLWSSEDEIQLNIADDGVGIKQLEKSAPKSFGILGMKERANSLGGTLTVLCEENKGTNINLSIPVEMEKK